MKRDPQPAEPLSPDQEAAARHLFDSKAGTLQRGCRYHALRRQLSLTDAADLTQDALLRLWLACRAWIQTERKGEISCEWLIRRALYERAFDRGSRRQHVSMDQLDGAEVPMDEASITVDGVVLTMADARLDKPDSIGAFEDPVSLSEAAVMLSMTKEGVRQACRGIGTLVAGRWIYPRKRIQAAAYSRHTTCLQ